MKKYEFCDAVLYLCELKINFINNYTFQMYCVLLCLVAL